MFGDWTKKKSICFERPAQFTHLQISTFSSLPLFSHGSLWDVWGLEEKYLFWQTCSISPFDQIFIFHLLNIFIFHLCLFSYLWQSLPPDRQPAPGFVAPWELQIFILSIFFYSFFLISGSTLGKGQPLLHLSLDWANLALIFSCPAFHTRIGWSACWIWGLIYNLEIKSSQASKHASLDPPPTTHQPDNRCGV